MAAIIGHIPDFHLAAGIPATRPTIEPLLALKWPTFRISPISLMKLRIRGNSVRIRVTKSELDEVLTDGSVADSARFGPESVLSYRLEVADVPAAAADFRAHTLTVRLPRAEVDRWSQPDQVSITGEQPVSSGDSLTILVEKDFECLEPRPGEDASEFFANPLKPEP